LKTVSIKTFERDVALALTLAYFVKEELAHRYSYSGLLYTLSGSTILTPISVPHMKL
jgi:hypothetical protein